MRGVEVRWEGGVVMVVRWWGRCRWVRVHDYFTDRRSGGGFRFGCHAGCHTDVQMVYPLWKRNSAIVEWWVGLVKRWVRARTTHRWQTRVSQARVGRYHFA